MDFSRVCDLVASPTVVDSTSSDPSSIAKLQEILNENPQLLEQSDWSGDSLLSLACFHGSFDVVKLLVEVFDQNVNSKNSFGATPLHRACSQDFIHIALFLIQKGADTNNRDRTGKRCIDYGKQKTQEIIIEKIRIDEEIVQKFKKSLEEKEKKWDDENG